MLNKEEIEKAKSWLLALDAKSEYGAISKEIILLYIQQLEDDIEWRNKNRKRLEQEIIDLDIRLDSYKELAAEHIKEIDQLESKEQKLIEKLEETEKLNNKYLQKLVYALTPTTHALGDSYNNAFKKIIADNIDLETCKIKRKLKECWDYVGNPLAFLKGEKNG